MQAADAIAVDDRGAEAFADLECLDGVRAGEADHFECGAAARLCRSGGGAIGDGGLGHVCSFCGCRSGSGPCGLPFDVDDQNRQRTDGFTGPIRLSQQGRFAAQQVLTCLGPRACPRAERLDRPLRGAQAALKRPAAGSDRNEKKGSGTGPMSDARRRRTTWPSPPPWEMSWLQDDQMPPSAQPR